MIIKRRGLLQAMAAGLGALAVGACARGGKAAAPPETPKTGRGFTVLHMTDMHVRRKRKGNEGYAACVADIKSLPEKPELALMGGDLAFDGLYTEKDEFADQIDLYKEISDSMGIPYHSCLGNHDLLGWSARRKVGLDDPDLGKKFIMDKLGMDRSYYSFDHKGWHFVVLDSLYRVDKDHGPEYEARIGEEQLDWLAKDLGRANKPTICVSHIAAFHNIGTIDGNPETPAMAPGMVLKDTKDLRLVLERHKVRALLQGHSHKTDDFVYRGVAYLTSPAVSSCWWGGTWNGFPQGYTILRCHDEQVTWERRNFAWGHQLEPNDDLERTRQTEWDAFEAEQQRLAEAERSA